MAAIGVAVYLLALAWKTNFGGIREKTAAFVDFIKTSFDNWVVFLTQTIPNAIQSMRDRWTSGFEGIRDAIAKVIDFVMQLKDVLIDVILPDWLIPGSPTPFEIGLLGIADALSKVNDIGLTPLASTGNLALPGAAGSISNSGSSTEPKVVNYNTEIINPKGEASEDSIRKSLKTLSYLGVAA